ncbi:MAG TPA: GNAT family N-acetyltransferase [Mucilaginibacter sp.]|jgi:RimJ/RimL family protein N-acetyltransferase|nr:GNAT family N-acetyltransferase [Mucilaginibacter sp.]
MLSIETDRLILRELTLADIDGMFELDADHEVVKYLGQKPFTSKEQSAAVINSLLQQYAENNIGRWAVIEKASNEFIGWSGLKLITEPVNGQVNYYDVGYRLIRRFWGKGYATESAKAAIQYGFDTLKADTIYGMCHVNNAGSEKVLEKLGLKCMETFELRGLPHKWFRIDKS